MSDLTQDAIMAWMEADATLNAMMPRDPNDGGHPAIFAGFRNVQPKKVSPQVVFFEGGMTPHTDPGYSGGLFIEEWHFQVWVSSRNVDAMKAIARRLIHVFHEIHKFPMVGATMKWSELVSASPEGYDSGLDEYFVATIFHFAIAPALANL